MKIKNRFYVGTSRMAEDWPKPTLEAAIKHGKEIFLANGGQDHVIIVQIVRVIRRKSSSVVVEKV